MKSPASLSVSLLLILAASAMFAPSRSVAQDPTETKIRLMSEALRARDAGDLGAAQKALEQLAALAPRDAAVQRLRVEIEAQAAARRTLLEKEAEAQRRAEALVQQQAEAAAAQRFAEARSAADEAARAREAQVAPAPIEGVNAFTPSDARQSTELVAVTIPEPGAARSLPREQGERPATADEAGAGRRALDARDELATGGPQRANGDQTVVRVDSAAPAATQGAAVPTAGAERPIREMTREQLIDEVTRAWQRPAIYQTRAAEPDRAAAAAPLWRKLEQIALPHVHWTRAPISEVVAALGAMAEQFDPVEGAEKGINLVLLDPTNKNPTVTITLRNATLKRVLDFVTESVGYQYEVQPDAVVVRPGGETSTFDTAFFPITRATVLRMTGIAAAGGTVGSATSSSAGASNAGETGNTGGEAAAMKAFLQQAGVSFTIEGSSLAYDGSAIIVTQTARNLDRIRNLLARYHDVRQVEIESKFMEVQEGALEELGVQWKISRRGVPQIDPTTGAPVLDANGRQVFAPQEVYGTAGVNRTLAGAFNGSVGGGSINISGADSLNVPFLAPVLPGAISVGSGAAPLANISGFVGEFDVNAVVRALSQKQGTDLLSSPKVTVLSGNPASITVAQEMRYPQSYGEIQSQVGTGNASGGGSAGVAITAGTPQEFTSRNVGVELKVTPTVEEDDYSISLDLNPKVTEFDGFVEYGGPSVAISGGTTVTVPPGFFQPIFSVRDISTRVTIWDGATLIMGGLTREEVKKVDDKIPVLGSIPVLGRLFRTKGESAQKRNLLIFVTANLVSPGGSPKKQMLPNTAPNSLFQNPTLLTPAGAETRTAVRQ